MEDIHGAIASEGAPIPSLLRPEGLEEITARTAALIEQSTGEADPPEMKEVMRNAMLLLGSIAVNLARIADTLQQQKEE